MRFLLLPLLIGCFCSCALRPFQVKTEQLEMRQQDSMYVVEIAYPVLRGSNFNAVNTYIRQQADDNVKEFKAFIKNYPAFSERRLTGNYDITLKNDALISIRQQYTWAVPGVSILLQYFGNVNYDVSKQKSLGLDAIFQAGSDYPTLLRRLITEQIEQRFEPNTCNLYSREKFKDFTIHKDFLTFYLDLYQGNPECQTESFIIPYAQLESVLRPEFLSLVGTASQRP